MLSSVQFKSGKPMWPRLVVIAVLLAFGILAFVLWVGSSDVPVVATCVSSEKIQSGERLLTFYVTNQGSVAIDLSSSYTIRKKFGGSIIVNPPAPQMTLEPGRMQVIRFVSLWDPETVELNWERHSRIRQFLKAHLQSFPKIGDFVQREHTLSIPISPAYVGTDFPFPKTIH
jgi:hypothetical protein